MWTKTKKLILDILFPKFCFSCKREGSYLCQDCQSLLDITGFHRNYQGKNLDDLYFSVNYKNPLVKQLIKNFKQEPFVKELKEPLSYLIISHFQLMDNQPDFSDFSLIPVPLDRKKLKWRGFNQTEELGKELSKFFDIPLISNCRIRKNEGFYIKDKGIVKNKNILLVDDFFSTGSTMEDCAKVLKEAKARKVIGIVIARE